MSPIQVYFCPTHGEFDQITTFHEEIRKDRACPVCGADSKHTLKPIAGIILT